MDVDMLERAAMRTREYVSAISRDELDKPTPCSEWDLRTLLNHLIGEVRSFAAATRGETVPFDDGTDHTVEDHVTAFHEAIDDLIAGFRKPGILEQNLPLPWGESPARVALGLAVADVAVHGWDVAKATGQDAEIAEDVAEAVIDLTSMMEPKGSFPRGENFGPPIEVSDDASVQERLLGWLGRRP